MPLDYSTYPAAWKAFSAEIRFLRAQKRCECTGECGLHKPNPAPRRCVERHLTPGRWMQGFVRLTVAHLCDCYPICANPEHVKAMCQACHLRLDRYRHAASRLRTQASPSYKAKRYAARAAQLSQPILSRNISLSNKKRTTFWTGMMPLPVPNKERTEEDTHKETGVGGKGPL